eukprot:3244517-Prymnesium_polylepis.1
MPPSAAAIVGVWPTDPSDEGSPSCSSRNFLPMPSSLFASSLIHPNGLGEPRRSARPTTTAPPVV